MANRFLNNIKINDSYTLPSTDGDADQIIQTDGAGNLSFVDLSSVEGASSNFVYFDVKNSSGATINKGKGVMAVGTDGNSGHILIDEMVADGSIESKYFLGVLETTVDNGGFARVISFGQLDQFDTRGQNGETWADGQVLWCDPANDGDFTITEPDGPNVKIAAAFILNSSTNGKIQVRVQANEGIHDLHDTKITSQVDGDVLVWDNTTGVWFNDSTLNVDYTAGNVGIGTTDPQGALSVKAAQYRQLDFIESNSLMTIRSTAPDASYNLRGFGVEANTILLKTGATSGTASTTALTLDASQNATFAGDIIGGGSITIGGSGGYNAGVIYSDANWGMIFRALQADPNVADFMFANSEDVERLRITSTGATFTGTGTFTGGGNTLLLKKGTGSPAIAFAGTATDPEASGLIEGIAGGGLKFYTSNGGTIGTPNWSSKLTIAAGGNATFAGTVTSPTFLGDLNGTINTATTGTTQTEGDNSTKIATTAYADAAAAAVPIGNYLPLAGGTMTGTIVGPTAGNSSANPPALQVVASGTGDEQASIAIQQATAEGDTIIFADYEPYVEYGISTENGNNKIQFTGGTTTGSLGSKTLYNNAGNARTAHIKLDHNLGTGDTSIGGSLTTNGVFTIQNGAPYIQWKNTSGTRLGYIQHNATNLVMSADTGEIQLNTTANSNILINPGGAGNVGIGTTSPASKLYVGSTWNTSYGGNNLYIKSDVDNTNYDPKVVTTSSIGVTIAKESATTTGPDTVGLNLYNNDGTAGGFSPMLLFSKLETPATQYKAAMAGIYARSPLGTGDGGSWIDGELIFATAGAASQGIKQRMVINKEGNVGIGTTIPGAKLEIKDGNLWLNGATSNYNPEIFFIDDEGPTGIAGAKIRYENNNGNLYFDHKWDTATSGFFFRNRVDGTALNTMSLVNGKVGIEMDTPQAPLSFNNVVGSKIDFYHDTSSSDRYGIEVQNSELRIHSGAQGPSTGGITFGKKTTSTFTEAMRIRNDGNVGIGTTDPKSLLHLNKTFTGDSNRDTATSGVTFTRYVAGSDFRGSSIFHAYQDIGGSDKELLAFAVGGGNSGTPFDFSKTKMVVTEAGNVGIGTTNPGVKLEVNGTFKATGTGLIQGRLSVGTSSSSDIDMLRAGGNYITATNASGVLYFRTVNDIRMAILANGNIGIGTTNPGDKLEVAGFIKTTGDDGGLLIGHGSGGYGIKIGRGRIGDNIAYLDFIGSEDPTGGTYDTRFIKNAGDNGNFDIYHNGTGHFSVNAANGGDILLLNGNVGIGTTNPGYKLDVSGDIKGTGNLYLGSTGSENFIAFKGTTGDSTSGYTTTYIGEYLYSGTERSELILYKGNDGHSSTSGYDRIRLIGGNLVFDVYDSAQSYPSNLAGVAALPTTRAMTILANSKVGIGTDGPGEKLEVAGNVKATNFILSSDASLKEDVNKLNVKVDAKWKSYKFKNEDEIRYGVIAQELEETNPELVKTDYKGLKSVKYIDLLIAKIAELEARLEKLEK